MLIEMDLFVARPLPINNSYSWTMALAWERCSIVRRSFLDRETLPTRFSASSSVLALHSIGIPAIVADEAASDSPCHGGRHLGCVLPRCRERSRGLDDS